MMAVRVGEGSAGYFPMVSPGKGGRSQTQI